MKKNILVVAAHPDDEILGCGGTIGRFVQEGADVYILILGQGIAARKLGYSSVTEEIKVLRKCAVKVAECINAKSIEFRDFPDNKFDEVPLLDVIKVIELFLERLAPEIVLSHNADDLNIDHRYTAQAVLTATRPLPGCKVKQVYAFETLSCSEWNFGKSFSPNVFVDISSTIELKKKAFRVYTTEMREFPHPRSIEGIEALARLRGSQSGYQFCEAFSLVRSLDIG